MKKQAINAFLLLSLLTLSAMSAYAQGDRLINKVNIPFNFSIRDKTLPAGAYGVTRAVQDKSALVIRSEDGQEAIVSSTMPVRAKEHPETAKLVFRRYGETYFLYQIWEPHSSYGREFLKSRTERSIERDVVKKGTEPSVITLVVISPRT